MEHNLEAIKAQATALLNELIEQTHFDDVINGTLCWTLWEFNANKEHLIPDHIVINSGSTRMVFWDKNHHDYIFKMNMSANDIDYNASELFIYQHACEYHVEDCFAWIAKVIDHGIFSIYAMPYCHISDTELSAECYDKSFQAYCEEMGYDSEHLTSEQREYIDSQIGGYSDTEGMLSYASEYYDEDHYRELCWFIDYFNLDDLHCGNWGFYQGQLVLTDYAGYCIDLIAYANTHHSSTCQE